MNSRIRTTLAAAALAALTVIAPNALAEERGRENPRSRGSYGRGHDNHANGYHGGYGRYGRHVAPAPVYRYGYGHLPYRVYSGYRFFTAYPGAGYVYIGGFGWVLPPFFGAVWVPGHYDVNGFWIEGFWR